MRKEFLPFALPLIEEDEIAEVVDTLRSNWITTGPKTKRFEEAFKDYVGAKNAIAVNSCTAGLHLALAALEIGPGDEVIVPSFTFAATANTVVHVGARPVFADIDEQTLCLDPADVEKKITPKTKAITLVHYAGRPGPIDEIMAIARKHGLKVIEDAAHAIYTKSRGRMIGSIGDITAFSFYATKNLVTAEGGMVTTNDDSLADKIRIMSLHGMSRDAWQRYSATGSWRYDVIYAGFKYNMTDIQASLGLHQLAKLERFQKLRKQLVDRYNEGLAQVEGLILPEDRIEPEDRHAWHLFTIRVQKEKFGIGRDELVEELKKANIGTSVHFIPVHLHPFYQTHYGTGKGDLPVTEKVFDEILSLPLYPKMSLQDMADVVDAVGAIAKTYA